MDSPARQTPPRPDTTARAEAVARAERFIAEGLHDGSLCCGFPVRVADRATQAAVMRAEAAALRLHGHQLLREADVCERVADQLEQAQPHQQGRAPGLCEDRTRRHAWRHLAVSAWTSSVQYLPWARRAPRA